MTHAKSLRATLSRTLRHLLPAALALATATCTQDSVGPSDTGVGYFTFRPTYELAGGASLAQFGIVADSIRIRLTRPIDQLVLDTTVFFPADSTELRLALPVQLAKSPDTLQAVIEMSAGGVIIFSDTVQTEVFDGPPDPANIPQVTFTYVGPGNNIADIDIIPHDTTIFLGDTVFFSATASDSLEAAVTTFYLGWSTSDTGIAKINANGRLIAPNARGTVQVIGITPTGIADSTTITFAPTPVIVTADSGNAQSAQAGDSLPALFVARVKGADSLGIAGIPVHFVAVTAGGAVRDTFVVTDSTGRAKTRGVLGLTAGAYTYTATALGTGLPARTFTATANSAVATAIAIVSGDAQVDTVAQLLPLPLVVHVTDAFTNPVAGVPVVFATVFGDGTVADDTVLTNASGNASIGYTLGISIGTDSITATIAGTSAFAIFNATGVADTPVSTQEFGGGNQTIAAGTAYPESLVVKVFDTHDNPVLGAKVVWSIFSGQGTLALDTTLTDSAGRSANALTAGTVPGQLQVDVRALPIVNGATITNFVTAAAPSAMTIGAGNGQSASGGTALPIAPTIHVVDAFGNVVPGVTVDFAVAAGGGTLDSAAATTDSAGDANAGVWTLGPSAGGNQVRATIAALPGDTLVFDAVALPSGTTKLWTGAIDNLWTTAGNWSPAGMPIGGDNLFIPAGVTSPVLNTPTVTGGLAIEAGAAVTVTPGVTLQLSGNLDLDGDLTGAGNLTLTGSGTTLSGNISLASVLINGTLSLSGPTTIAGNLTLNTGPLTVGGQALTVAGNLSVGGGGGVGQLVMNNAADSVDVGGQFTVNSITTGTGKLSAGVLVIRGDFTQNTGSSTNFAPSGTHTTRFLGTGVQTIVFATPSSAQSRFQEVEFGSPAGTTINSTVTVMGISKATAGTVTGIGRTINIGGGLNTSYATWQVSTTLWGQDPTVYPDSLPRHVTVFGPWTLTKPFKTDSSVTVSSGGILTLGGNALTVGTTVSNTGRIVMTNAADSLDVAGAFGVTSGVTSIGDLTNGVLVLHGNFSQVGGSSSNFQPSGAHRTRFLGSSAQSVNFSNVGGASSRFMGVEFGNATGVTLTSNIYVAGPAAVTAGTVTGVGRTASLASDLVTPYSGWQVSTSSWVGGPSAYPDSLPRNVTIGASLTLTKPFKVDSAVSILAAGIVTLNGNAFRIGGTFTQTGVFVMASAADTLDVAGLITVNSGFSGTGSLSAGLIRVRGGFTQVGGASSNFAPSGGHLTRFEATGGQTVTFTNIGAALSRFQALEVADSLNVTSGLYIAGATTLLPGGKVQSTGTATLAGPLTDSTDLGWRYQSTNLSGTVTSLPDSIVSNVTLLGSWAIARRTSITGSFAIGASATLDLNGDSLLVYGPMTQGGIFASSDANGALGVAGPFTVNSASSGIGSLTAGHLALQNGFTQNSGSSSNFAPTGSFLTTFAGTGGHTVAFSNPGTSASRFQDLEVLDSLTFTSNLAVNGNTTIDTDGRIVGATRTGTLLGALVDSSGLGWRVTNTSIPGGQVVPDSLVTNLTLTGAWTLPNRLWIDGNLTISSTGSLDLGVQRLDVSGTMTQTGEFKMLQPADTLSVAGLFTVNSALTGAGDLVDGTLLLHGGFQQNSGSSSNFAPSGTHLTHFVGSSGQPVNFTNATFAASHFSNVAVSDSLTLTSAWASTGLVTVDSAARVIGAGRTATLGAGLVDDQTGWLVGATAVTGTLATLPDSMTTDLVLADTFQVTTSKHVVGDVTVQTTGVVNFIGGPQWRVTGDFTLSGRLSMQLGADLLWVDGNFLVNSPVSNTTLYGRIYIGGDFQQVTGAPNNFAPAGPLLTAFLGTGPHAISFATPQSSYFAELSISGASSVTLGSDVFAADTLHLSSTSLTTDGPQRLLRTQKLQVTGVTFDKIHVAANSPLTNVAQFDDVTFTNIDPTLTQLSVAYPGQVGDTLKFHNVAFSGTPTTGRYVYAADSVANDGVANIAFYNSSPLNGSLFTAVEGSVGDTPNVLWSHLEWQTDLVDGVELIPILASPEVKAVDPSGVTLPGYTGTVTLAFFTDPSAGAASLGGNSVAAIGGVATFDALTVSLGGVGYQLQASTPDLGVSPPSALFTISLPLPVGTTTAFNNGGGDNDWDNALNWTFGVPDSTDNVFVFPGQTASVNTPARANTVTIGAGGTILLNAPLAVDSSVTAGNTIAGGGQLIAQGTGYLSGVVGGLVVTGNYLVPVSDTLTADFINISGASAILDPGSARIVAIDSLRTEAGGHLDMNDVNAVVTVQGLARFTGGTPALVAGTLEIGGDFSQEENVGAFSPSPSFVTLFNGGGTQTATFFSPDTASDHFGELVLTNGGTLHLSGTYVPILGNIEIQGGHVVVDTQAVVLGTVTGATGAFMEGATLLIHDNFAFGGVYTVANTIFIGTNQTIQQAATQFDTVYVQGSASLAGNVTANAFYSNNGGQFDLAGHRLDVVGDFGTFQTGVFSMTDPADTLMVGGSFYGAGGSTTGLLTDGLLQVAGNFIEGNYVPCCLEVIVTGPMPAFDAFRASGNHLTRLAGGTGTRIIYFATPVSATDPFTVNNSHFGNLELTDGTDTLLSTAPAAGDLTVISASLTRDPETSNGGLGVQGTATIGAGVTQFDLANFAIAGTLDFQAIPAVYAVGSTVFFGDGQTIPVLPYNDIEVVLGQATLGGDLSVGNVRTGISSEGPGFPGDLRLGGYTLTVNGSFSTVGQGSFTMDDPADSLDVSSGGMDLGGGVTTGLTAGNLVLRGDLYLSDSTLVASGTHKTIFAAAGTQQLWITTSPTPATQFNRVTVLAGATVQFNAFSVGPMVTMDTFWVNGFFLQAATGKTIIAHGDLYAGVAAGITVDTVELHEELEIDASGYSTQLTRYAGTGQVIASNVGYNDVEVTGTASLGASTNVGRDLRVAKSGQLTIGAFGLGVTGSFRTLDSGTVVMTDPASSLYADTAEFAGGSTAGLLTAGTLQARTLIQANPTSDLSYFASGAHVTQIGTTLGGPEYRIQMATGDASRSRIRHLILADGGVGSVPTRIVGRVTVTGKLLTVSEGSGGIIGDPGAFLSVGDSLIVQDPATDIAIDTLELFGGLQIPNNTLASGVVRFMIAGQVIPDSQTYAGIEAWGNVGIEPAVIAQRVRVLNNGRITIGNGQGLVANVLRTEQLGTFEMAGPTAQLQVLDTLVMAGGSTAGLLRQGFLTLSGDLIQDGTNSPQSFAVDSQMYTFFTNPAGQFVNFATPGDTASHFGFVNLQPNAVVSINATGTVPVWGEMNIQNGANLGSNAGIDVAQNMVSGNGSMVTAPLFVFRTGSAPDPSTTWNVARTAFAGTDTLNIPQVNYLGDVEIWTLGRFVYPVAIAGTLRIGGAGAHAYASWSGVGVTANGLDVIDNSQFGMTGGLDSLLINGTAHFDGGYLADQLTGGTIVFGGDIVQDSTFLTQSFGASGTQLEFTPTVTHKLTFASPDNSPWPYMTTGGQGGDLNILIVGRLVVAGGGLSANGLILSGDTLENAGPLDAGSSQLTVNLLKYVGTSMGLFANVGAWNVTTTHFTGGGGLPYSADFIFDTLIVSGPVQGQLSQLLKASYVEITGPGNPRHLGDEPGELVLSGGDGNTTLDVSGDVVVRGAGAHISSFEGDLSATGDLTVDQDAYLYSTGSFGGASWAIGGDVLIDGASTKDSLVKGSLSIGGNFTQLATTNTQSWAADSGFTTVFQGTGAHVVSFATPGPAGSGSHYGSLSFNPDSGLVMQTDTDLWVEGLLTTVSYADPTLQNTAAVMRTINVQDVAIQGITFDHLQLHLAKASGPTSGANTMDIVNFTNFLTTEDQFLVDLPGQAAGGFSWSNFTWKQLATDGSDTGHYLVATDSDGSFPFLGISIGTNQASSGELGYYVGLSGAIVTPFSP